MTEKGPPPELEAPPLRAPDFDSIFAAELDFVWRTLARFGVRDADLPDVTQDVFVTLLDLLPDYDPTRPLRPWLVGIAYRIALRYRSRAHVRREVFVDGPERSAPSRMPDDDAELRQAQSIARVALESIDPHRRAVFVMSELEGFTMPEIVDAIGIPLNTAYSRLRVARQEFQRGVDAQLSDRAGLKRSR